MVSVHVLLIGKLTSDFPLVEAIALFDLHVRIQLRYCIYQHPTGRQDHKHMQQFALAHSLSFFPQTSVIAEE